MGKDSRSRFMCRETRSRGFWRNPSPGETGFGKRRSKGEELRQNQKKDNDPHGDPPESTTAGALNLFPCWIASQATVRCSRNSRMSPFLIVRRDAMERCGGQAASRDDPVDRVFFSNPSTVRSVVCLADRPFVEAPPAPTSSNTITPTATRTRTPVPRVMIG